MKKTLLFYEFILIFIFACHIIIYAENIFSESYNASHLYVTTDANSFPYVADAKVNKMKMTQDDYRYYISFDIDYECKGLTYDKNKIIGSDRQTGGSSPGEYDIYQGTEFGDLFVSECPNYGIYRYVRRRYSGNSSTGGTDYYGHFTCDGKYSTWEYYDGYNSKGKYTNTTTWNGNTYYIFPNIFYADNGDCNAYYDNGNNISYTLTCDYTVNYWKYNAKGTITINKSDTVHYNYLNLCSPFAVRTQSNIISNIGRIDNGSIDYTGYGLYATPVDISSYLTCDHDFEIINIGDKANHKKYCKKCEWTITEPHELIYEYDGIENNMCICGYNDKVRYDIDINDDTTGTLTYIVDSYGTIPDIPTPHKTGYIFDYFEKYEKFLDEEAATPSVIHNNLKEVLVATCSTIELSTSEHSTIYRAHFTPIHYTFHFSNENNLGLSFDDDIGDIILEYDAPMKLKPHIHIDGYIFEGWTYATTSDIIIFTDEAEVLNHTSNNFDEFILYPRYRPLFYTIMYKGNSGVFINGLDIYEKKYSYFDESRLEVPAPYNSEAFFRFYITNIDNIGVPRYNENESDYNVYKDMQKVKDLLAKHEYDFVILYAQFGTSGIGSIERTRDEKAKKLNNDIVIECEEKRAIEGNMVFNKGYKKDLEKDKIYVYDLSQTIYEKFSDRISSTSYIVQCGNMKVDLGFIISYILDLIKLYPIESLLWLILLLIAAFYAFLKS